MRSAPMRPARASRRSWGQATCVGAAAVCALHAASSAFVPAGQAPSRRQALLGGAAGLAGSLPAAQPARALTEEETEVINMFKRSTPSVLSIMENKPGVREGSSIIGSGFAWDQNHVVTTASMLADVAEPRVTITDKDAKGNDRRKEYKAALVGLDQALDIAVLWVDGEMRPLHRGQSEELRVGQQVYALGNPFGFEHSLSKGVVSGLARTMPGATGRPVSGIIQTDASINPGNNGGPLLDSNGAVVGVNNAILSSSGTFAGIGLAIPIESIERSVTSVIQRGFVAGPSLGITLAMDDLSEQLGISEGVMVRKVDADGPAAQAGMRPMHGGHLGDIIVGIDSQKVDSVQSFFKLLDTKAPGQEIVVKVRRENGPDNELLKEVSLSVQLGARVL